MAYLPGRTLQASIQRDSKSDNDKVFKVQQDSQAALLPVASQAEILAPSAKIRIKYKSKISVNYTK